MGEHANLSAMVRFVRNHVAQHLRAGGPWTRPSVLTKLSHSPAVAAKRFSEHGSAASGALGQCGTRLPRRASRTVKLGRNSQVRRRQPDPLRTHVVHVRKDGCNCANLARRLSFPGGRVKTLDKNLVQAIIGGKDPNRGMSEFRLDLAFARGHSFVPP